MYRFTASPSSAEQTVHHLSADGRQLFLVYITEHEQESRRRFKSETLRLLLEAYCTCISEGMPDGSDALYQRLTDGLGLTPSKAKRMSGSLRKLFTNHLVLTEGLEPVCENLSCERSGDGRLSIRAGMVVIGVVEVLTPDADAPNGTADNGGQNGAQHNDKEQEEPGKVLEEPDKEQEEPEKEQEEPDKKLEEHNKSDEQEEHDKSKELEKHDKSDEQEEQRQGDSTGGQSSGDPSPHWWNLSTPVIVVLFLLLAAVSFFVTLLLTGRISLGAS